MRLLTNTLWFLMIGIAYFLLYIVIGLMFCGTLIFIPAGIQCFKCAAFSVNPIGRGVAIEPSEHVVSNILWGCSFGVSLAVLSMLIGVVLCLTVVGIPFGLQCFKLMKLSYAPFGAEIEGD